MKQKQSRCKVEVGVSSRGEGAANKVTALA